MKHITKSSLLLFLFAANVHVQSAGLPSLDNSSHQVKVPNQEKDMSYWILGTAYGAVEAANFHNALHVTLKAAIEGRVMDTVKNGAQTLLIPTIIGFLNYASRDANFPQESYILVDSLTISWLVSTLALGTCSCLKAAHEDRVTHRAAQARQS